MEIDENTFLKTERRKIPYNLFLANPKKVIKQLLGQGVVIKSCVANDIITDDECFIVDIEYYAIAFSPFKFYFVNTSDLKQLIPGSAIYATQINGCNIKIVISSMDKYKKLVPITINVNMPNNVSSNGPLDQSFSYFGKVQKQPMNFLCTPLKYPNHQFTPFKMEPIKPIFPADYKYTSITEEETKEAYKSEISATKFALLSSIDNIVIAKSFDECKMGTTGYVIDIKAFPKDVNVNGVILIQPKRIPTMVLFFPTSAFTICAEEMDSIREFIAMDEINAKNFDYCMNVLNK